jgi:hypothetical protein
MTKVAGAIVLLAGAIVFSTSMIMAGAETFRARDVSVIGFFVGAVLGIIALYLLFFWELPRTYEGKARFEIDDKFTDAKR